MNINEVNSLTNSTYSEDIGEANAEDGCKIDWAKDEKEAIVYFAGGGGVGAAANPVIGRPSGAVIALHLAEGGFGYKYPPQVIVKTVTGLGGAVVALSLIHI